MRRVMVSPRLRDSGALLGSADRLHCDLCGAPVLVWQGQWQPRGPSAVLCMVCAGPTLGSWATHLIVDGRTANALAGELGLPPDEVSRRMRAIADGMGCDA